MGLNITASLPIFFHIFIWKEQKTELEVVA